MKGRPELFLVSTEIYFAGVSQSRGEGKEGYGGVYTSITEPLLKSIIPFPQSIPAGQRPSQGPTGKGESQVPILCREGAGAKQNLLQYRGCAAWPELLQPQHWDPGWGTDGG